MDTHPKKRVNLILRQSDWDAAEKLRASMGLRSCSDVVRKLIRDAVKEKVK